MSAPDTVTILTTKGPLATKRITFSKVAGKPQIQDYARAKSFSITERPVSDIHELAALLDTVSRSSSSFIVRGRPAAGVDRNYATRRLRPRTRRDGTIEPATLEAAARHWIPLDIDSIPCPDSIDPIFEPNSVIEHVVERLPEEFHGATCYWQFTSGHGIKPGIRVRLYFWSDRPLEDWELQWWLDGFPVDKAIFRPAQPIYVARPIFDGAPDPVPVRSGIWEGDRDEITPPAIARPKPRKAAPGNGSAPAGGAGLGYEGNKARIGDGEGKDGFYKPIMSVIGAYFARNGSATDAEWLRADLEQAIREHGHTRDVSYVEARIADLDGAIRSVQGMQAATEAQAVEKPATKGVLLDCAAYFPAADMTPDIARPELQRTAVKFLDEAILAAKVRKAYGKKLFAGFEEAKASAAQTAVFILESCKTEVGHEAFYRLAMKRANIRIKADVEITEEMAENAFERIEAVMYKRGKRDAQMNAQTETYREFGVSGAPKFPRLQLKAAAGLGKTSFVADELVRRAAELEGLHVHFYVPRNDLAEALTGKIPGAKRMRGRGASIWIDDKTKMPYCHRNEAAEKLTKANLPVMENLCRRSDGSTCPFFDHCLWVEQWKDHAPGVRVLNHAYIGMKKPFDFPSPDVVIVDESVVKSLVGKVEFTPCRITRRQMRHGNVGGSADFLVFADKVAAAINETGNELRRLREAGITAEDLKAAASFEEDGEDAPRIKPEMEECEIIRRVDAFEQSEAGRVARMYQSLADEIDLPRDQSHGAVQQEVAVTVEHDGFKVEERQNRVSVNYLHKVDVPQKAGLLLIDADANIQVNRVLFGEGLEEVDIRVKRNAEVIQVHSTAMGKTRFTSVSADSSRVMGRIRDLIKRETDGGCKVLVITYLAVRLMLTGEERDGETLPVSGRFGDARVAHFGNIRGCDDFKEFDTVIIIGRFQQPIHAIEAVARAIWALDPQPLKFITDRNEKGDLAWSKQPRGYTMKDGSRAGVEIDCHPDERCQMILEMNRECETAQAIDRLRLIHRDVPGRVLILSSLPVDIEVDRLMSWKDLSDGGTRFERAWQAKGILSRNPEHLHLMYPKFWKSKEAAAHDLKRKADDLAALPNAIEVEYRMSGTAGMSSHAMIDAVRHTDHQAALREALGEQVTVVGRNVDMGETPEWVALAMDRVGGVALSLTPESLFQNVGAPFTSVGTTKRLISKDLKKLNLGPNSDIYTYRDLALNVSFFKSAGQRCPSKALVVEGASRDAIELSLSKQGRKQVTLVAHAEPNQVAEVLASTHTAERALSRRSAKLYCNLS